MAKEKREPSAGELLSCGGADSGGNVYYKNKGKLSTVIR